MTRFNRTTTGEPIAHRPSLLIRLELEARPAVMLSAASLEDEGRLRDWLHANPALLELAAAALNLADDAWAA